MLMSIEEIRDKIIAIVKEEMDLDLSEIDPDRDLRDQVNIDSMKLTEIYAAVVEELNIQVPLSIMNARTFNDILRVLVGELDRAAV